MTDHSSADPKWPRLPAYDQDKLPDDANLDDEEKLAQEMRKKLVGFGRY